ncbi:MAG: SDR family oxidoreductase [Firmicutes bacterium]|jgi:NAD(P)-dependent dehydrogenase (short-subunit alcohol dehydrogenase family)|nr:SDR family oxidoreductase [Bacillota bacterium]
MFTAFEKAKVVVTGGANGIGKTIALGFAKRGSDVAIVDIHGDEAEAAAAELRALGSDAFAITADVSVLEQCGMVFDTVMKKFGRVDVLVNDAGVSALSDVEHIPEKDIRWVYETNVYSHWFMMQKFLPQMRAQKTHCQIINVCSIAGLISMNGAPAYFSSKHAAVALSECVYKQMRAENADIDVSVFCPGYVKTEMHLTDRHRPERFAIRDDEPYYHTEEYAKFVAFNKYLLDNGNDVETAVDSIFKALEKDQFYILDTPKYERLLCEQGVFEAEKVRPVDYYTLN